MCKPEAGPCQDVAGVGRGEWRRMPPALTWYSGCRWYQPAKLVATKSQLILSQMASRYFGRALR